MNRKKKVMKKKPYLLPPVWHVPDEFKRRLGSSVGRQRLMEADGQLLLILHALPEPDETQRRGRIFWLDAEKTWHSSDSGAGVLAINKHLNEYSDALDRYEELENRAQVAEDYLTLLEGLAPLVRSARNMLQVFEDARKAVPADRELLDCRDRAYEISRRAELLGVDAKNAMDVAVVRRAEQQAEASDRMAVSAHRLNVLVALFFPIATLAAVFSTSLTEGWGLAESHVPFAAFIIGGLVMGILLASYVTRTPGDPTSS